AGELHKAGAEYDVHPTLNLKMPKSCPGVDSNILDPRNTWEDKEAYAVAAEKLVGMFRANFEDKGFATLGIEPVM
ncbi:MAG TPA: phosphoenolpyruvate carboxykinase (ATP), partial [Microbacterium sp.]|nr:phosphoenolpyruvate carboxykinase (ATP) [Microbacterium sp.]